MKLAYFEKGNPDNLPLILIHAFPLNRQMWRNQLQDLSSISYVLAPDLPGFGESLNLQGDIHIHAYADAIIEFMDHFPLSKAVLAGCSMGGYILFDLWRRYPERIAGLILADTRSEADSPEAKEKRLNTIAQVQEEGTAPLAESMVPNLLSDSTIMNNDDIVKEVRDMILSTSPQAVTHALHALAGRPDSTDTLYSITVPTLIIVGEDDGITPPEIAQSMQKNIPKAQLAIIPNAGHLSPLENPKEVNSRMQDFLVAINA